MISIVLRVHAFKGQDIRAMMGVFKGQDIVLKVFMGQDINCVSGIQLLGYTLW